jgi:hypothetical protein
MTTPKWNAYKEQENNWDMETLSSTSQGKYDQLIKLKGGARDQEHTNIKKPRDQAALPKISHRVGAFLAWTLKLPENEGILLLCC